MLKNIQCEKHGYKTQYTLYKPEVYSTYLNITN